MIPNNYNEEQEKNERLARQKKMNEIIGYSNREFYITPDNQVCIHRITTVNIPWKDISITLQDIYELMNTEGAACAFDSQDDQDKFIANLLRVATIKS